MTPCFTQNSSLKKVVQALGVQGCTSGSVLSSGCTTETLRVSQGGYLDADDGSECAVPF